MFYGCLFFLFKLVSKAEGEHTAKQIGALKYMECSARTQEGLHEMFTGALQ